MPYLVRVRFVNDSGNLSPKTYEYKAKILPSEYPVQYFNIETSDGNNYRNSKVVITDVAPINLKEFEDSSLKEIIAFREAGAPISEKHLQEMGRKNVIIPIEPCDFKLTLSDALVSSNCASDLNQSIYLTTSNSYDLGQWLKQKEKNVSTITTKPSIQENMTIDSFYKTEKEKKTMFENITRKFKFGPAPKSDVKMSPFGIAFKNNDDGWVTINDEGVMTSVDGMVFDMPLIYMMPVAVKDVQIGDYIDHNGAWVKVMDENERGNFVCLHPWLGEEVNVIPAKSPFGFDFVTKLVCFGEDMFTGKDASAQSPFGSMLPFMLMANGDMNDNSMLPLMLMMQNNGVALDMSNPFMLMALMGDKNGSKNNLMLPLMCSMMAKKEHKCDGRCKNCED